MVKAFKGWDKSFVKKHTRYLKRNFYGSRVSFVISKTFFSRDFMIEIDFLLPLSYNWMVCKLNGWKWIMEKAKTYFKILIVQ